MPIQDNVRAYGAAIQSALDALNLPSDPLYGITDFTNPSKDEFRSPHYKTNRPFTQTRIAAKTRQGEVNVDFEVSPTTGIPFLASGLGPDQGGGIYKSGVGGDTYLTSRFAEGMDQYWVQGNGRVNTLDITYDVEAGTLMGKTQLLGPSPQPTYVAWTTAITIPTGLEPFDAWQVFITKNGVAAFVKKLTIKVNNHLKPVYSSPGTPPDSTTPAGVTPKRYARGDIEVTWDAIYEYTDDATSSYYNFRNQIEENDWEIHAFDPRGTASVLFRVPRLGYTKGEIDRKEANLWTPVSGFALFNGADETGLIVTAG